MSTSPLAAPDTSTTLSLRLNSGRRFVVPKYAEAVAARSSAGGAGTSSRADWDLVQATGQAENARAAANVAAAALVGAVVLRNAAIPGAGMSAARKKRGRMRGAAAAAAILLAGGPGFPGGDYCTRRPG